MEIDRLSLWRVDYWQKGDDPLAAGIGRQLQWHRHRPPEAGTVGLDPCRLEGCDGRAGLVDQRVEAGIGTNRLVGLDAWTLEDELVCGHGSAARRYALSVRRGPRSNNVRRTPARRTGAIFTKIPFFASLSRWITMG